MQQAASESSDFQRELWKQETIAALEKAEEEGVTVYKVDTTAFAAKVAPVLEQVDNTEVRGLLKQISEVQ